MNKITLSKNISLVVASLFSSIMSLVYFIKSYSFYQDDYGTEISFSKDYTIALVISLLVLGFAIYKLVCQFKKKEVKPMASTTCAIACNALASFYTLGTFFKALFKAVAKASEKAKPLSDYFTFADHQAYLYIGILCLVVAVYYLFKLLELNQAKKD